VKKSSARSQKKTGASIRPTAENEKNPASSREKGLGVYIAGRRPVMARQARCASVESAIDIACAVSSSSGERSPTSRTI